MDLLIGAMQVHYSYMLTDGARDVKSLVSCEARACARFRIFFENQDQKTGSVSLPHNITAVTAGLAIS